MQALVSRQLHRALAQISTLTCFVYYNTMLMYISEPQHDTCPVCRYSLNKGSIVLGNESQNTVEEQESMESEAVIENQTSMESGSIVVNQA